MNTVDFNCTPSSRSPIDNKRKSQESRIRKMTKTQQPLIYRNEGSLEGSPAVKTYKHTPRLNIDNKIALFESHAQATQEMRRVTKRATQVPITTTDPSMVIVDKELPKQGSRTTSNPRDQKLTTFKAELNKKIQYLDTVVQKAVSQLQVPSQINTSQSKIDQKWAKNKRLNNKTMQNTVQSIMERR